jgi:hypothetical protein
MIVTDARAPFGRDDLIAAVATALAEGETARS